MASAIGIASCCLVGSLTDVFGLRLIRCELMLDSRICIEPRGAKCGSHAKANTCERWTFGIRVALAFLTVACVAGTPVRALRSAATYCQLGCHVIFEFLASNLQDKKNCHETVLNLVYGSDSRCVPHHFSNLTSWSVFQSQVLPKTGPKRPKLKSKVSSQAEVPLRRV